MTRWGVAMCPACSLPWTQPRDPGCGQRIELGRAPSRADADHACHDEFVWLRRDQRQSHLLITRLVGHFGAIAVCPRWYATWLVRHSRIDRRLRRGFAAKSFATWVCFCASPTP